MTEEKVYKIPPRGPSPKGFKTSTKHTIYTLFEGQQLSLMERILNGGGITKDEQNYLYRKIIQFKDNERRIKERGGKTSGGRLEKIRWTEFALEMHKRFEFIQGYFTFDSKTRTYKVKVPKNAPALENYVISVVLNFGYKYEIEYTPALPDKLTNVITPITQLQAYQIHEMATEREMTSPQYLQFIIENHLKAQFGNHDIIDVS